MHIGPITARVRLANDEKGVALELRVAFRREGELGIVFVGFADLPQDMPISGEGGQCRRHRTERGKNGDQQLRFRVHRYLFCVLLSLTEILTSPN